MEQPRPSNYPPPPPPPPNFGPDAGGNPASMGAPRQPQGPIAGRGTRVDIRVACRSLISLDGVPPSSFAVVFSRVSGKSDWVELTRSETVRHNPDPDYSRIFQMEYRFELYQEMRVVIFDRCTESDSLQQQTLIGVADCTLGKIVSSQGASLDIDLVNVSRGAQNVGKIYLTADEIISSKKIITIQVALSGLLNPTLTQVPQNNTTFNNTPPHAPTDKPTAPKRGAAALMGRFRRDDKKLNAFPAHQDNLTTTQEQNQANAQAQLNAFSQAGPVSFVPFLTILRAPKAASGAVDIRSPEIQWEEVYKSLQIPNYSENVSGGFQLEPFSLSEYDLCEGDENRLLKLAVVDVNAGPVGTIVGEHITTFPALRRACVGEQHTAFMQLEPVGQLTILKYEEETKPSFMDYLRGGWCDFGLICAVDFTSSNGNPRQLGSRHYMMAPTPNEYEAAMRTVANMLASYSSDRRIPSYGFGAQLPPNWTLSHCFPIAENEFGDPFCDGVEGLIRAYKATLGRIQLHGPTIFSEVLSTVGVIVSRRTEAAFRAGNSTLAYTVLLILTDGVISDYDATVRELIRLSSLPLSIVIIGVGTEDFGRMHALDSSKGTLRRGVESAKRQFIQFVPYLQFKGDLSALAERVLGNIPDQVISYIEKVRNGQTPGTF